METSQQCEQLVTKRTFRNVEGIGRIVDDL